MSAPRQDAPEREARDEAVKPAAPPFGGAAGLQASRLARRVSSWGPGLALAALVALASFGLERGTGFPATVTALLLGMALNPAFERRPAFAPGVALSVRSLLRIGIALLGIRIAVADIWALGAGTAALVIGSMAVTIASGVLFAQALGRDRSFGALAGGATAVCGASAALAISTVLPPGRGRANEADTAFVVVAVNALSTVAMVAYPLLARALDFDATQAGVLLGATIHDVAQVVGAGYSVSERAGDTAVIVKLFRVALLLPVVLVIGWWLARGGERTGEAKVPVPMFAVAFLALAALNSLGLVPAPLREIVVLASKTLLLLAIAALGLKTSLRALVALGAGHAGVVTGATLALLLVVLAGQIALR